MIVYHVTRIDYFVYINDYPIGKILQCHIWVNKNIDHKLACNYINEKSFPNYNIFNITTILVSHFCNKPEGEEFNVIIEDSMISAIDEKNSNKENVIDIENMNLDSYTNDKLLILSRNIRKTIFKRKHNLSDDEVEKRQNEMYNVDLNVSNLQTPIFTNLPLNIYSNNTDNDLKNKKKLIREKLNLIKNPV
jgi:hypothetical protein